MLYVSAVIFFGAYLVGSVIAILANFHGAARLFALAVPVNGLFLPFFGKGTLLGIEVHSFIWWWLFGIGGACAAPVVLGGPFQLFVSVEDSSGESRLMRVEEFRAALLELLVRSPGVTAIELLDFMFMPYAGLDTVKKELESFVRVGLARKEASAGGDVERYFPASAVEGTSSMSAPAPEQAAAPGSVICRFCLAPNPPERVNCQGCGRLITDN